jgi:mRNA interferase MazF
VVSYIPKRRDIVWLDFTPQSGKEIKKTRPALVVSPLSYNKKTGLFLVMPITSQVKGYPFECLIKVQKVSGAILCDQIRSLDWQARRATFIATLPEENFLDVMSKLSLLLG